MSALGDLALGAAKLGLKMVVGIAMNSAGSSGGSGSLKYSGTKDASSPQSAPATTSTTPWLREERAKIDAFFSANANRPLGECKEEILSLITMVAKKAYHEGGAEMEAGIQNANPNVRWR
jgi:hypothetical protein